jgi:hypothetical protein
MGKIISSPVPKWPGTVTLPDWLTLQQEAAWEEVCEGLEGEKFLDLAAKAKSALLFVKVLIGIVERWDLGGDFPCPPTLDTWPATPKISSALLMAWLIGEVSAMHEEATTVPLAFTPEPTSTQTVTAAPDFQPS